MAEPENHTLRLLRELRHGIKTLDRKVDAVDSNLNALDAKLDRNHEEVKERIDMLRQAAVGESILGRYATAGLE